MRGLFGFYLLSRLFGDPIIALAVLIVLWLIIDRKFIGLFPDWFSPFRRARAIRRLRQTLNHNPADANAALELGSLLAEAGKWQEALPYLERAAAKLESAHAFFQLGAAYVRVGKLVEGHEALTKALAMNPRVGYGEPYLYLAELQLKRDGKIGEVPGLDETLRNYGSVEVRYRLGRLYEQAGDPETARRMYQEAWETHRENPRFLKRQHRRTALRAWLRSRLVRV